MADNAFFCRLEHEGILSVRGVDAGKFLQGQLTCNLNYLNPQTASLGARCTPKGRMQSSFRIVTVADGFLMAMALELVAIQQADLQKYAVFSKSRLADESADWVRLGLSGADAWLADQALDPGSQTDGVARNGDRIAIRLDERRVELSTPVGEAGALLKELTSAGLEEQALQRWLLAQVRAGVGQVFGATRESFIPQMINLQAVGGVSFRKGCYTGQEIVARMQYLGKLKRRLYRLALAAEPVATPGTPLFSPAHGSSVGEVVLAAGAERGQELLAVLQEDAVQNGPIHLGTPDGQPLTLLDLPYALDADREIQR